MVAETPPAPPVAAAGASAKPLPRGFHVYLEQPNGVAFHVYHPKVVSDAGHGESATQVTGAKEGHPLQDGAHDASAPDAQPTTEPGKRPRSEAAKRYRKARSKARRAEARRRDAGEDGYSTGSERGPWAWIKEYEQGPGRPLLDLEGRGHLNAGSPYSRLICRQCGGHGPNHHCSRCADLICEECINRGSGQCASCWFFPDDIPSDLWTSAEIWTRLKGALHGRDLGLDDPLETFYDEGHRSIWQIQRGGRWRSESSVTEWPAAWAWSLPESRGGTGIEQWLNCYACRLVPRPPAGPTEECPLCGDRFCPRCLVWPANGDPPICFMCYFDWRVTDRQRSQPRE